DDVGGRVPGSTDAEPAADFIARQVFGYGRDVRQPLPSRGARHRQGAQLAGRDLLHRQRRGAEEHLHLSAQQVAHHRAAAPVLNVDHLDPAMILNSSPAMWPTVPVPADAMLSLRGLALA